MILCRFQETNIFEFESTCTSTELQHNNETFEWEVTDRLQLDVKKNQSTSMWSLTRTLPVVDENVNDGWEVELKVESNNDSRIFLRYSCLNEEIRQFHTVAVRLFASAVHDPSNWTESADVLRHNVRLGGCFLQNLSQLFTSDTDAVSVTVRVRWTSLIPSPETFHIWVNNTPRIHCRWILHDWKSINPSVNNWKLWSKPFGCGGVLWRMCVHYLKTNTHTTGLKVSVHPQHIPGALIDACRKLTVEYTLKNHGDVANRVMAYQSNYLTVISFGAWAIADDVKCINEDTLDLSLDVGIQRSDGGGGSKSVADATASMPSSLPTTTTTTTTITTN